MLGFTYLGLSGRNAQITQGNQNKRASDNRQDNFRIPIDHGNVLSQKSRQWAAFLLEIRYD
jgi:hypothetical protein